MTNTGKLFFTVLALAAIGGGLYYSGYFNNESTTTQKESFKISGEPVYLVNGVYEKELAPGSASKMVVAYFGNEVTGDFNQDGITDSAFLVTQTTGGSGTFFYLATALGGEAVFIGDRIAPQTTEYSNEQIIVNYADRKEGEPMTANPSVGVSKYFKFENGNLVEIKKETSVGEKPAGKVSANSSEGKCVNAGGQWSAEHKECMGVGSESCVAIGGTFNECASACRHNPKAEACIMMCVQVCTF